MKHYVMKAYGGVDVLIHIFLASALSGGEWSASLTVRFTPGERAPGTHWIGGWVDPRASLNDVEKRKLTMDDVQKLNNCINILSSQTFRSYLLLFQFTIPHVTVSLFYEIFR
jgi:hypothetical protein